MPPKRDKRRGGDDDDDDDDGAEQTKQQQQAKDVAGRKKGSSKRRDDDEDELDAEPDHGNGKKKGGNNHAQKAGQAQSKKAPIEEEKPSKSKGKGKKRGDDSEDEEVEQKPAFKSTNRKKGQGDDDDDAESVNDDDAVPASGAAGGLSKTALKKAKREAKKGKATGATEASTAKGGKGRFEPEDEEEDEEVEPEESVAPPAEEEEEEEEEVVDEVAEQIEHLALETVEEPEEELRLHKSDKKKKKKEEEKKKKVKAAHGIIDLPPSMPTPPPQHVPDDNMEDDEDMIAEEDGEQEAEADAKEEKKKKKDKKKKDDSEKKKKKKDKKEESEDDEDETERNGEEEEKSASKEDGGEGEVADDEEPEDLATALATKKKKLSNKEKRKLKDSLAMEKDIAIAESMSKPPDNKVFAVSATSVDVDSESWKQSRDVIIPSFSITTTGKTLFHDAELKIAHGRRYGLVGPNGLGKSVLLRAIATRELPVPPTVDCLYVEQEVTAGDELAVNVVLSADTRRSYLIEREKELMRLVDDPTVEQTDEIHDELIAVSDELRISKADSAEAKALNLLHGLGFSDEMCRTPTKHLSGGWRMRVSIAKGLFLEPTLLLLDEPTNHLDLEAVIFLESVLSKWEKTLVVVSHDQDFLDEICQEIIHLDSQKLWYYKGNYSQFEQLFEVQMEQRKKDYERQVKLQREEKKQKNRLTARERENEMKKKMREKGAASKSKHGVHDEDNFAIAAAGKNRGEKNAENAAALDRPKDYVVKFSFPPPSELTPPIIQVRDVNFRYNDNSPWLFRGLNFGIDMSSRICICGPNGAGKSTLIGLLTQSLSPTDGEIIVNRHLRIAAYKQHFVDALPLNKTPIEYLHSKHNQPEQDIRGRLGRYGLSGVAHTIKMASLSGGQKARVVFADMSYQNPHIIIAEYVCKLFLVSMKTNAEQFLTLSEPSNNLDMQSIRALGEAINEFEGGVILVSHDTRLITETNMILWVVERQTVLEQTGGIDEYREEILEKIQRREAEAARILEEKQAKRVAEREAKLKELEERRKKRNGEAATSKTTSVGA